MIVFSVLILYDIPEVIVPQRVLLIGKLQKIYQEGKTCNENVGYKPATIYSKAYFVHHDFITDIQGILGCGLIVHQERSTISPRSSVVQNIPAPSE